jgi:hypothetical protein
MNSILTLNHLILNLNKVVIKNIPVICAYPSMSNYIGTDWKLYKPDIEKLKETKFDKKLLYQHDTYDLFLISWYNTKSDWHNHSKYGCILKVLEGTLQEYNFHNHLIGKTTFNKGNIGHKYGHEYHCIVAKNFAYSLHLYAPNNSEKVL